MAHFAMKCNLITSLRTGIIIDYARLSLPRSHIIQIISLVRPVSTLTTKNQVQGVPKRRNIITKTRYSSSFQGLDDTKDSKWNLVYEGPLSKPVKYVKRFSLTTAAASIAGSPILVYFGKQSVPLLGKLAIAGLLCIIGSSTTVLLHWFSKAYVHRMYYDSSRHVFSAETSSFFGRLQRTDFEVKDIVLPEEEGAFSTFEVKGKKFFLHQEMVETQQVLHFVREEQL